MMKMAQVIISLIILILPDDKDDRPTDAEDSLSDEEKKRGPHLIIPATVLQ